MSARHADGALGAPGPDALQGFVELQRFGLGGRKLVFDSGLVALDDPRITAVHEGYDDLVSASTDLLDRCCTAATGPLTAAAFDRSTQYEIAFWQMAYSRGKSDFVVI